MLRKAMAFTAAAMLAATAAFAGQYEERPYVPGEPPPEAQIGEAWCIYVYPAEYKTEYVKEMVRPETMTMKPVAAVYGRTTQTFECEPAYEIGRVIPATSTPNPITIDCRPAYEEWVVIPAKLRAVQKEIVVCPEYTEEYWVPATFATRPQTFTITPERKELRKVACVDGTNIDCYTVVGAAARTETVQIKVLEQAGRVETRTVPAQKQVVTVYELESGPQIEKRMVPAQTQTVQGAVITGARIERQVVAAKTGTATVMTVEKEATVEQVRVDAVYKDLPKQVLVAPERVVWRKQMLTQPVAQSYAPAPVAEVAPTQLEQDYGSIPGTGAVRTRTVNYIYK